MTGIGLGAILRQRREALGIDLDGLSRAIGGTPSAGFLARLEEGIVGPSSSLVLKLAAAFDLPGEVMLNAAGFATQVQRAEALAALGSAVGSHRTNGA